jgi:hypothetical protein
MDRQASMLRAVRANLWVAIAMAAFTSVGIAIFDFNSLTWAILSTVWMGWLGFAVIIGVSRGWKGGM